MVPENSVQIATSKQHKNDFYNTQLAVHISPSIFTMKKNENNNTPGHLSRVYWCDFFRVMIIG